MVYDWDGKEDELYQLYIVQKKSLDEIVELMKEKYNFSPSKRAYQTQFKKWQFPAKQHHTQSDGKLAAEVRKLWENNIGQKESLKVLNDRGLNVSERELVKIRSAMGLLLRVPNGTKLPADDSGKRRFTDVDEDYAFTGGHNSSFFNDMDATNFSDGPPNLRKKAKITEPPSATAPVLRLGAVPGMPTKARAPTPELDPEVIAKRQERLRKKREESEMLWQQKKRRRRTRDRAGLPADPPCPPRFPSETTIDESKKFLSLSETQYRHMRDAFMAICKDAGIMKKTQAGPDGWKAAKERLARENEYLRQPCFENPSADAREWLAVDIICSDVTKRIRVLDKKMTIQEAKNTLGINPEESRQIRRAFYDILKADHFTSKSEAGSEHWAELKAKWIDDLPMLKDILAPRDADPEHEIKKKAVEILGRDVMKRLRDDIAKRDPNKKMGETTGNSDADGAAKALPPSNSYGIQSHATHRATQASLSGNATRGLTAGRLDSEMSAVNELKDGMNSELSNGMSNLASQALATHTYMTDHHDVPFQAFQIDPALMAGPVSEEEQMQFPAYFRVSPNSELKLVPKMWIDIVNGASMKEVEACALSRHPMPTAMRIERVEGIASGNGGSEQSIKIDTDDELSCYLDRVIADKVIFSVCFGPM
ncbi:MAG: hypothetical protein MMC33_005321 [Icmadophila ericetorum]|nr:hypothetical protein [Icmadophila ericetorum]